MSTVIGCVNGMSALRRPPPIADGFVYAVKTRLLGLGVFTQFRRGSSPSRIGAMSAADPATGSRHRDHRRPVKSP